MCTFNTNELIQQKEAKRFSRSIRLDSKIPLLRVLTIGWTEKQGQILCTLGKVRNSFYFALLCSADTFK